MQLRFFFSSWSIILVVGLSACVSKEAVTRIDEQAPVTGRLYAAQVPGRETRIFTNPAANGGVMLSTQAGQARRPVILEAAQAARLIHNLDKTLDDWSSLLHEPYFRRPVDSGVMHVREQAPYSVEVMKRIDMEEPQLLVAIGFADERVEALLDKNNAERWLENLEEATDND